MAENKDTEHISGYTIAPSERDKHLCQLVIG